MAFIESTSFWRAAMLAALGGLLAATGPAGAKNFGAPASISAAADEASDGADENVPPELDDDALADALNINLMPATDAKQKALRAPSAGAAATWSTARNPDGSAKYSVNKSLAAPWDAEIGADISTSVPPPAPYDPRPLPSTTLNAGSGAAWANVAVPHLATVEVRAEPANDYDKVGTKFERSLPLGKSLSLTVQSTFAITELHATPGLPPPIPAALPSTAARLFDADKSLQLNILSTGTTLLAGSTTVTGDPITHNRLSAAQKIYGPLNVTGSINDLGQPTSSKSITAGLDFSW